MAKEPLDLVRLRRRVEKLRAYLLKEFPNEQDFDLFSSSLRQRVGFKAAFFVDEIGNFLDGWQDQNRTYLPGEQQLDGRFDCKRGLG